MTENSQEKTVRPVIVSYRVESTKVLRASQRTHGVPREGETVVLHNEDAEGEELAAEGFVVVGVEWRIPAKENEFKEGGTPGATVKLRRKDPTERECAEYREGVHDV